MIKAWTSAAWDDFIHWYRQDKKTLKRILSLVKDIERNGYEGIRETGGAERGLVWLLEPENR